MNLKHHYWFFDQVLSNKLCDDIIKFGNSHSDQLAVTGKFHEKIDKNEKLTNKEILDLKQKRDSNIVWLDERWIYREIQPYIHIANKNAGWNFQWDFSEACQFTKYKLNQYYDWHSDSWDNPYTNHKNKNYEGKIRKLSVTCQLTDKSEYEGGELQFQLRNLDDPTITINVEQANKKGSIIVFPSHLWHRVKPITSGTRYSLVIWNLGRPFI